MALSPVRMLMFYFCCTVVYTTPSSEYQHSTVCMNDSDSSCTPHHLQCLRSEALIIKTARYGFIGSTDSCHKDRNICYRDRSSVCCRVDEGRDHLEQYDGVAMANLYTSCNGLSSCEYSPEYDQNTDTTKWLTYSTIMYVCSHEAERFDLISQDRNVDHNVAEMTIVSSSSSSPPSSSSYWTCMIEFNTNSIFVFQDNRDDEEFCIGDKEVKPLKWFAIEGGLQFGFRVPDKEFTLIFRAKTLQNRFRITCENQVRVENDRIIQSGRGEEEDDAEEEGKEGGLGKGKQHCRYSKGKSGEITLRKMRKNEMEDYFIPPSAGVKTESVDGDGVKTESGDGDADHTTNHDDDDEDDEDDDELSGTKTILIVTGAIGVSFLTGVFFTFFILRKYQGRREKKERDSERDDHVVVDPPPKYEEVDLEGKGKPPDHVDSTSRESHDTYNHIGGTKSRNSSHNLSATDTYNHIGGTKNRNSDQCSPLPSSQIDTYNHIGVSKGNNSTDSLSPNDTYNHIGVSKGNNSTDDLSQNDTYNHIGVSKGNNSTDDLSQNDTYNHIGVSKGNNSTSDLSQSDTYNHIGLTKNDNSNPNSHHPLPEDHTGLTKNDNSDYLLAKNPNSQLTSTNDDTRNHIGSTKNHNPEHTSSVSNNNSQDDSSQTCSKNDNSNHEEESKNHNSHNNSL